MTELLGLEEELTVEDLDKEKSKPEQDIIIKRYL